MISYRSAIGSFYCSFYVSTRYIICELFVFFVYFAFSAAATLAAFKALNVISAATVAAIIASAYVWRIDAHAAFSVVAAAAVPL